MESASPDALPSASPHRCTTVAAESVPTLLPPPFNNADSPPFYRMAKQNFQPFCRDLLQRQPGVATCDVYGVNGQSQHGIDLLAHRDRGDGVEVGECKCHERFGADDIREAADRFVAYWAHWRTRDVRRFILLVACDVERTEAQDEILTQRERFRALGVEYEVWSAAAIRERLRPHRDLVARYLSPTDHWIEAICNPGVAAPGPPTGTVQAAISAALAAQLTDLTDIVSGETDRQVARLRQRWREGHRREVTSWLDAFAADRRRQGAVGPAVAGRVLRFHAGVLLQQGRLGEAEARLDDARTIDPDGDDVRWRALIALRTVGVDAALGLLAGREDRASVELRAAVLLGAGRERDALAALDGLDASPGAASNNAPGEPAQAEAHRLRALAHRALGDAAAARAEVARALAMAPTWVDTRRLAAELEYHAGLSPAVPPAPAAPWATPIGWELVCVDREGRAHFDAAFRAFTALLDSEEEPDERQDLEAWRLACLANQPERQDEAAAYCRELLAGDPKHPAAILWALGRGLDVDFGPSERALRASLDQEVSGPGGAADAASAKASDTSHVVALCALYVATGHGAEALDVLDQTRAQFQREGALSVWSHWRVHSFAAAGRNGDAWQVACDLPPDESRPARAVVLTARAARDGDFAPLAEHLDTSAAATGGARDLLAACEAWAHLGHWDRVAERADALVARVATTSAVHLAAGALYEASRHRECVALVDGHLAQDPVGPAALELRRVRAGARAALGALTGAIEDLEAVAAADDRVATRLHLAQLYVRKGDMRRVAQLARALRDRPDLPARSALGLAEALVHDDPTLARDLWRRAVALGVPDGVAIQAYTIGTQLGLEQDTRPLLARISLLGREGRGGVWMVSIADLAEHAQEWSSNRDALLASYRTGVAPAHGLSAVLQEPLVRLYHGWLATFEAAPNPLRQFALRARHGGRPFPEHHAGEPPAWRLRVDPASLILAHHLGILPLVERACGPLRLPHDIARVLLDMRDQLTHHQPSRLDAVRLLVDAIRAGRLRVRPASAPAPVGVAPATATAADSWLSLLHAARTSGGYLLDFRGARADADERRASGVPTELLDRHLVTSAGVARALRDAGPLAGAEYAAALDRLGSEGRDAEADPVPEQGTPLYCAPGTLELLAVAGLLEAVCDRFTVFAEDAEQASWIATLDLEGRGAREVAWLNELVRRVNDGLETGAYELMPVHPPHLDPDGDRLPLPLTALADLLGEPGGPDDAIWVDDRFVNAHAFGNGARIVDVIDVLAALRARGVLPAEQFFECVRRLRAANVRFIPVTREEILFHLRQAPIRDGRVVETRGLITLRRYAAACLLDADSLRVPPLGPDERPADLGELSFVTGLTREAAATLAEVWRDALDGADAAARAEWVLEHLYADLGLLRAAVLDPANPPDAGVAAVGLAGLVSQAIGLLGAFPFRDRDAAAAYLQWLDARVLAPRFDADPEVLTIVSSVLKSTLLDVIETDREEAIAAHTAAEPGAKPLRKREAKRVAKAARNLAILLVGALYDVLPQRVRAELARDADFARRVGRMVIRVFQDGDVGIATDDFARAAAAAQRGQCMVVRTVGEAPVEVAFEPPGGAAGPSTVFQLRRVATGEIRPVHDDDLRLLVGDAEDREAVLRGVRDEFDMSDAEFAEAAAGIARLDDPLARVEATRALHDENAAGFYERLAHGLRTTPSFRRADLMALSTRGLRRHLRLGEPRHPEGFAPAWTAAAGRLLAELPLAAALDRLEGLPVPLPEAVFDRLESLPEPELRSLVAQRLARSQAPLAAGHGLYALARLGRTRPAFRRLARVLMRRVATPDWLAEAAAFGALLRWVEPQLRLRASPGTEESRFVLVAAWYHAHRLFRAFADAGADMRHVGELFDGASTRTSPELFERSRNAWYDVVHPRRYKPVRFALATLHYAVGADAEVLVDETFRDRLRNVCLTDDAGTVRPDLSLLEDLSRAQNALDTYLQVDLGGATAILGDAAEPMGTAALGRAAEQAVATLEAEPENTAAWFTLFLVFGDQPVPSELASRLAAIVRRADFVRMAVESPKEVQIALYVAACQTARAADADTRAALTAATRSLAAHLGRGAASGVDVRERAGLRSVLLEVVAVLATSEASATAALAEFARQVDVLIDVEPAMAETAEGAVQRLWHELPLVAAGTFTRLVLRLRVAR